MCRPLIGMRQFPSLYADSQTESRNVQNQYLMCRFCAYKPSILQNHFFLKSFANKLVFSYGCSSKPRTAYPSAFIASAIFCASAPSSSTISTFPLACEALTLLTFCALRTASATCASHAPHIIPSTVKINFFTFSPHSPRLRSQALSH